MAGYFIVCKQQFSCMHIYMFGSLKGQQDLYKPVGGAGANFCMTLNMLLIRDPFFQIKKYLQII